MTYKKPLKIKKQKPSQTTAAAMFEFLSVIAWLIHLQRRGRKRWARVNDAQPTQLLLLGNKSTKGIFWDLTFPLTWFSNKRGQMNIYSIIISSNISNLFWCVTRVTSKLVWKIHNKKLTMPLFKTTQFKVGWMLEFFSQGIWLMTSMSRYKLWYHHSKYTPLHLHTLHCVLRNIGKDTLMDYIIYNDTRSRAIPKPNLWA